MILWVGVGQDGQHFGKLAKEVLWQFLQKMLFLVKFEVKFQSYLMILAQGFLKIWLNVEELAQFQKPTLQGTRTRVELFEFVIYMTNWLDTKLNQVTEQIMTSWSINMYWEVNNIIQINHDLCNRCLLDRIEN